MMNVCKAEDVTPNCVTPCFALTHRSLIYWSKFLLMSVAISWPSFSQELSEITVDVTPSVKAAISGLPESKATHKLASLISTHVIGSNGQVGKTTSTFSYVGPNLLASVADYSGTGSSSARTTSLSLCGLLKLMSVGDHNIDLRSIISLPLGKIIMPLRMKTTGQFSFTRTVDHVAAMENFETVCAPVAGKPFSFGYQVTLMRRGQAVSSSTATVPKVSKMTMKCMPSSQAPVSNLVKGETGIYVPVECESTTDDAAPTRTTSRWAYLSDSATYVQLDFSNGTVVEEIKVTSLQFKN